MFKSSRKKLIAIGCSYTQHYLSSIQSPHVDDFPILQIDEKINMEHVFQICLIWNVLSCGQGIKD